MAIRDEFQMSMGGWIRAFALSGVCRFQAELHLGFLHELIWANSLTFTTFGPTSSFRSEHIQLL